MQATLLSIGIAIILALLAAIFGPHFVDWSAHRAVFEERASAALGVPVRIAGRIDAHLLPTLSLTLGDVETREPQPRFRAQSISLELAVGSLMRGEWRVTELALRGPDVAVAIDADGKIGWPSTGVNVNMDALSVERLDVTNGRVRLTHAGGGGNSVVLDRIDFHGELRSLAGPIKGDGVVAVAGEHYGFRISTGRRGDDGAMRARLSVAPTQTAISMDADGTLRFADAGTTFDGALTLARTTRVEMVDGRAVQAESWKLTGRTRVNAQQAAIEQLELQYGPDERALKLGGTAEVKFAPRVAGEVTLSARQVDLDRIGDADGSRGTPMNEARAMLARLRDEVQLPFPLRLSFASDVVTLGGAPLQNVHFDAALSNESVSIERLELRAPGTTNLHTSGTLRLADWSYAGPASIDSADPRALAAWLEGRPVLASPQPAPLRASGDVVLAPERIAIEKLSAQIDGKPVTGSLNYQMPADREPRLDAELRAPDLDLDSAQAFVSRALPDAGFKRPAEVSLVLDLGRTVLSGIEARGVTAKLISDATKFSIERLRIEDVGGATVTMSGTVEDPWGRPRGGLKASVASARADRLTEQLAALAPAHGDTVRALAASGAIRLEGELNVAPAGTLTQGKLRLTGALGQTRLNIDTEASGDPAAWSDAQLRSTVRLQAEDGPKLLALFGFDTLGIVPAGPASLEARANGSPAKGLQVETRASGAGVTAAAEGTISVANGADLQSDLRVFFSFADLRAARALVGAPDRPAPLEFRARVQVAPEKIEVSELTGTMRDTPVKGQLLLRRAATAPSTLEGRLETEAIDLVGLAALLSGSGARPKEGWPTQPFAPFWLNDVAQKIELRVHRAQLGAATVRDVSAVVRIGENEAAIDNVDGTIAGGRLRGRLVFQGPIESFGAALRVSLTSAEISELTTVGNVGATGRMTMVLDLKGAGRSAAALMSTLSGTGTLEIDNLQLARLSGAAFDRTIRAVDDGLPIDVANIRKSVEGVFETGRLRLGRAAVPVAVAAGQMRLNAPALKADGAEVTISGTADLIAGQLDARLALLGPATLDLAGAGRPEIGIALKGPIAAPQRAIDVSTLIGWLTLRSVDLQAKRIEALEVQRKASEAAAAAAAARLAPLREPTGSASPADRVAPPEQRVPLPEAPSASIVPPVSAGEAARIRPSSAPLVDPPPRTETQPVPLPQPRRVPPTSQLEPAPALPPPVDVRPPPGARRPSAAAQPPPRPAERGFFESIFGR